MSLNESDRTKLPSKNDPSMNPLHEEFDNDLDEDLECFIDLIIQNNFDNIRPEELLKSVQEIKEQKVIKTIHTTTSKPKKEFQLSGLILEKMKVYDGLKDVHLQDFLLKRNRRQILIKTGLMNEQGFITNTASTQFKINREQQRKVNKVTNCKAQETAMRLPEHSHVSPYYNNSCDYKDKLYKKLYTSKPNTVKKENEKQVSISKTERIPPLNHKTIPKKQMKEKGNIKIQKDFGVLSKKHENLLPKIEKIVLNLTNKSKEPLKEMPVMEKNQNQTNSNQEIQNLNKNIEKISNSQENEPETEMNQTKKNKDELEFVDDFHDAENAEKEQPEKFNTENREQENERANEFFKEALYEQEHNEQEHNESEYPAKDENENKQNRIKDQIVELDQSEHPNLKAEEIQEQNETEFQEDFEDFQEPKADEISVQ